MTRDTVLRNFRCKRTHATRSKHVQQWDLVELDRSRFYGAECVTFDEILDVGAPGNHEGLGNGKGYTKPSLE